MNQIQTQLKTNYRSCQEKNQKAFKNRVKIHTGCNPPQVISNNVKESNKALAALIINKFLDLLNNIPSMPQCRKKGPSHLAKVLKFRKLVLS